MSFTTQEQLDAATQRALHYLADMGCEAVIICAAAKKHGEDIMLWKVEHQGKDAQSVSNLAYASMAYMGAHLITRVPVAAPPLPAADVVTNTTMTPPAPPKKQLKDFRTGLYYGVGTFKEIPREDFVGNFAMVNIPHENSGRKDRAWVEVLGVDEDDSTKLYGRLCAVSTRTAFQTGDIVEFTVSEICGWNAPKPPDAA